MLFRFIAIAAALLCGGCLSSTGAYRNLPSVSFHHQGWSYSITDKTAEKSLQIVPMVGKGGERELMGVAQAYLDQTHPGCRITDRFKSNPNLVIYEMTYACG